jgi:hypothetical protein
MESCYFGQDMKEGINAKEFRYFQYPDYAVVEDCPANIRKSVFAIIHNVNIG